jgi:DNA (cytosine-5)-methyltransferase 3A
LIGGSPCQGFSFAGKQLNFEDPRSKLFFEFVRLLKECKPKFFLLENVKMKKEYQDVISDYLGVHPLEINSSLVSAQNRKRLYWTNIPNVSIPKDKKLELSDIVEDSPIEYWGCAVRCRYNSDGSTTQKLEISKSKKSNALTTVKKDSMVAAAIRNQVTKDGVKEFLNIRKDLKSNCVVGSFYKKLNGVLCDGYYRTLTAIECERLQTLPDGYTNVISETQRYRALGNGWTVDVIAHIFKNFKKDYK